MKILQINDTYSLVGGSEKTLRKCSEYLARAGHDVVIAHGEQSAKDSEPTPWRQVFVPELRGTTVLGSQTKAYGALANLLQAEQPDVVHARNFDGLRVLNRLERTVPVVRTVHTIWGYCPNGTKFSVIKNRLCDRRCGWICLPRRLTFGCATYADGTPIGKIEWIARILACKVTARADSRLSGLAVTSECMRSELAAQGVPRDRVAVIPPPIEVSREDAAPRTGGRRVLFVGRMIWMKGLRELLNAAGMLPQDVDIDIVGDGPIRSAVEDLARRLGVSDRLTFHGWVDHSRLGMLYRKAGVVAFPATGLEAFGNVGPEALVHYRPVVAFDVGGVREWLVDGENGYLAQAGDVAGLVEKLMLCLDDPERSLEMGKVGRRLVEERFTAQMHAQRTIELYQASIERWKRKHARPNSK